MCTFRQARLWTHNRTYTLMFQLTSALSSYDCGAQLNPDWCVKKTHSQSRQIHFLFFPPQNKNEKSLSVFLTFWLIVRAERWTEMLRRLQIPECCAKKKKKKYQSSLWSIADETRSSLSSSCGWAVFFTCGPLQTTLIQIGRKRNVTDRVVVSSIAGISLSKKNW